jgi:calcineurin-like phosphoesterase family protein
MMQPILKCLSLSDIIVQFIYSPHIRQRFSDVDLVIGCGDLPYYYLEYVISTLNVPLYFVRGNHDKEIEYSSAGNRNGPLGGIDLHRRTDRYQNTLIAGVEGCLRYRNGLYQYSQAEMWRHVFALIPGLFRNKLEYGRYLDIFVTHAPPRGIHDGDDLAHQGIDAFRWFIKVFHPTYHFHGHIHLYRPDAVVETCFEDVQVINTFGYRESILARIPR